MPRYTRKRKWTKPKQHGKPATKIKRPAVKSTSTVCNAAKEKTTKRAEAKITDSETDSVVEDTEQWLEGKTTEAASTSATLSVAVTTTTKTLTVPISQNNFMLEDREKPAECTTKRDNNIVQNTKSNFTALPPECKVTKSEQNRNHCVDEVDMQETDSDEEGYRDFDFYEEFQLIECGKDDESYSTSRWVAKPLTSKIKMPVYKEGSIGQLKEVPISTSQIFYFYELIGGAEFFETLAECCNKRTTQIYKSSKVLYENVPNNKAITAMEMSIFFGICLQMGSMQFTTLAEYWECQAYHGFNGLSRKMSLARFKAILEVLNFEEFRNENTEYNEEDKFVELKPLLDFFTTRMESIYECGQNIVINDPLMYWKGKFNWVNDMKQIFHQNAVLLHFLTEPSGLILKICLDLEDDKKKLITPNSKELVTQRTSLALELLREKIEKGHIVYTSAYYSSYALCLKLLNLGTYSLGFLAQTRFGNCRDVVLKNLTQLHQFHVKHAGHITMGKIRRSYKSLYFYSSNLYGTYAKEFKENYSSMLFSEIKAAFLSSENMRAKMLSYQLALGRGEIKWDRRLMIYIMQLMLLNAFHLYKQTTQNQYVLPIPEAIYDDFRQEIIASLLDPKSNWIFAAESDSGEDEESATEQSEKRQLVSANHQPKEVPTLNGKCVKKRCRLCSKGGFMAFSKICCGICPGMPGLCETPCFKIWHDHMRKKISAGKNK